MRPCFGQCFVLVLEEITGMRQVDQIEGLGYDDAATAISELADIHTPFWGTDLAGTIAKLKARGLSYDLRRLPENGPGAGVWQLFFLDPNGARVEIDLASSEVAPEGA